METSAADLAAVIETAGPRDLDLVGASSAVLEAGFELLERDYRSVLRAITAPFNEQMSEDEVRARVDATVAPTRPPRR